MRKMMKEKRLTLNRETFSLYNDLIFHKLIHHPQIESAQMIGCYVSLPEEVETFKIIEALLKTKQVCVPKVEGSIMHFYQIYSLDELKEGCFHVLEPIKGKRIDPVDIDCMIVPMLAYDQQGYRVGYGKGYYDKYFASGFNGYKLGIAFSFQYVDKINYDEFDYRIDEVITEL